MKKLFNITMLMLFLSIVSECHAQQLVQTISDVKKLEINKDKFIGKPLENLLKQIKPPIRRMYATPGGATTASHIFVNFVSDSIYNKIVEQTGKSPILIDIQVAEGNFEWNPFVTKAKGHRFDWTEEDEKKYGKLTVVNIRVRGTQ